MLGFEPFAIGHLKQLAQDPLALARSRLRANDPEMIATVCDFDVEATLDLTKVLVELAAEIGEPGIILGLEYQIAADCTVGQSGSRTLLSFQLP